MLWIKGACTGQPNVEGICTDEWNKEPASAAMAKPKRLDGQIDGFGVHVPARESSVYPVYPAADTRYSIPTRRRSPQPHNVGRLQSESAAPSLLGTDVVVCF